MGIAESFETPALRREWTVESFWKMADTERMIAEYQIDRDLEYLSTASPEQLRRIFVQYRFFTLYYIADLAFLVGRLPFGNLRSSLGLFLSEELGNGDPAFSHPRLYDDFLRTMQVPEELFETPDPRNKATLDEIQRQVMSESVAYAIGLRGMGGECLCQIYLSVMFNRFAMNPYFQENKDKLALRFWDIHTGDEDIHHREQTRRAIDEYLKQNPTSIGDLAAGYDRSKTAWDVFWKNIFLEARRVAS